MENCLSGKLGEEKNLRNLPSTKIVWGYKSLDHSQFANDTILLGGASTIIASKFENVLELFTSVLGGMINMKKFKLYVGM